MNAGGGFLSVAVVGGNVRDPLVVVGALLMVIVAGMLFVGKVLVVMGRSVVGGSVVFVVAIVVGTFVVVTTGRSVGGDGTIVESVGRIVVGAIVFVLLFVSEVGGSVVGGEDVVVAAVRTGREVGGDVVGALEVGDSVVGVLLIVLTSFVADVGAAVVLDRSDDDEPTGEVGASVLPTAKLFAVVVVVASSQRFAASCAMRPITVVFDN